jgi:hypothetical protein
MPHVTVALLPLALAAAVAVATSSPPPVACNRGALDDTQRARQHALEARLAAAVLERHELADGFAFTLDAARLSLAEVGEWIGLEARCCPFLDFDLRRPAGDGGAVLTLTGSPEAKAVVAAELAGLAGSPSPR